MIEREPQGGWHTTADGREALSAKLSDRLIILLPLGSGKLAVYNTARELCGLVDSLPEAYEVWRAPAVQLRAPAPSLEELGLL